MEMTFHEDQRGGCLSKSLTRRRGGKREYGAWLRLERGNCSFLGNQNGSTYGTSPTGSKPGIRNPHKKMTGGGPRWEEKGGWCFLNDSATIFMSGKTCQSQNPVVYPYGP